MQIEIITPKKKIYTGNVKLVRLPGMKGSFEILKNHAPIISTLDKGEIKVMTNDDEKLFFEVSGGVIECKENVIVVLADTVLLK